MPDRRVLLFPSQQLVDNTIIQCLAFRGIEGCIPFLHGSQGCATYIRRYLISHFREPVDIASSNFHEESAIFGGSSNFKQGISNVLRQYQPELIGIATTCLAETIGEDMARLTLDYHQAHGPAPLVHVSTASYRGTHVDGFHSAVRALIAQLAVAGSPGNHITIFPGMVSAADLRYIKEICAAFGLPLVLMPDYSDTMDGATWSQYEKIQEGGTSLSAIATTGSSRASIEFGLSTAGVLLAEKFNVPRYHLPIPIGIVATDNLFEILKTLSGLPLPQVYAGERGRLLDSYVDGHKYVFEKRAIVFGEEDLVMGITDFLNEIGVTPVLSACGNKGWDFAKIAEAAPDLKPDFLIGNSKGYKIARALNIP
ncbi:nitrogenase, partial [Achromatium sp. WMS2]